MPVFYPDHEEILQNATWSEAHVKAFNPHNDPIRHVREWLAGYEYRLETADRTRRFKGATTET